jgi:hypothetical protein
MRWNKMNSRMCIQDILKNRTTICPISFAQNFGLVLYIGGKGKHYHAPILVETTSQFGEYYKSLFVKDQ